MRADKHGAQASPTGLQYESACNLNARAGLHRKFSTNPGWISWVFDQMDLPGECRILEVGCGTGALWSDNIDRIPAGWQLVLSDSSPGMLDIVQAQLNRLPQVTDIVLADIQAIPYCDESFDAVIANYVLYHVADLEKGLAEIARVLRPGGSLYAATIGQHNMKEFWELLGPLIEDVHARIDHEDSIQRFSLETGADQLARRFAHVTGRRFEDSLLVTEVEPLVAYAQSFSTNNYAPLSGERLSQFRDQIRERICRDGVFRISKSNGILIAKKAAT